MKILLTVLCLIVLLAAVLVVRTLSRKSTAAAETKIKLDDTARADEYGRKLSEMIKCETISCRDQQDRTKFFEFHKKLEELFPNVHSNCEKHIFNGSLLFKWQGKGNSKPVLFMSHQDVVEANGKWEHEPFSGDIDETGRIWGRGTVDTKASLCCIFEAVEELIREGFEPECDVYIASSCTEEWSGEGAPATVQYLKDNGVELAYLMDEGGMILEEPVGGVKGIYGMVGVVEKGYGDVKFVAKSNGGHASAPTKNTPLVRLGKFMADVEKNYPFRSEMSPTVKEMFRRMTPNMNFGMKLIFSNLWLFEKLLLKLLPSISSAAGAMVRTTLAFTTAKGSDGYNVLPQEAYVTGNMRYIPHQDRDESISIISEFAKKYDIETEVIYSDSSCPVVDYNSRPFHMVEEVAAEVYPGVCICPYTMTGGTDAKFYKDITPNALRFAPLYIDKQQYGSIHALNENIFKGALPMAVDFYKKMIKKS
ncbi:MAG: M20/M25/M40 family metallo-hydrolase [Oscillospiraceae bacterium]|nr:M20/M25/M40 family metallo-hydrolase [Oscillospiraceae bacterium]